MLGLILDASSDETRSRFLTRRMGFGSNLYVQPDGSACFFAIGQNMVTDNDPHRMAYEWTDIRVGDSARRFDQLCLRFGLPRIANAIRNRVLSPRTRAERIALRLSTESVVR